MAFKYLPLKPGTYTVSSPFGPRDGGFHYGMDFAAPLGTPFYAPVAGVIVEGAERDGVSGFGKWVWLDAQDSAGVDIIIGHGDPAVRGGDRVHAGQLLGYVNTHGESTGPHAHIEVWTSPGRVGGQAVDPAPYFTGAGSPGAETPSRSPSMAKPDFTELDRMGNSSNSRGGAGVTLFLLHTEEGNSSAESLAAYLNNPGNDASYHYTVGDSVVCDVVDTDRASWSVLDANPYSINLCFAGSRASWSRAQWLTRDNDLRIAAWIAVQDCRKYGIPLTVIAPPYRRGAGISDHRYVTDCLGVGTHSDCGDGFPWDVFSGYVAQYAGNQGDDDLSFANETIKNKSGQDINAGELVAYIDLHINQIKYGLALVLEQFAGKGAAAAFLANEKDTRPTVTFPGWEQGGGRTLYDLSAATAAKAGVDGAADKQAPKAA
ncbi:peptidoglycan DD-metalloendopeptidase family protein [Nocardia sp. NPDC059239]|uniref:peptidoglycan DD-metalloendopeptidase family protein n=1 Tax=unclassified Nocardia TaxID=2637762 RepID=UPI00367AE8F2